MVGDLVVILFIIIMGSFALYITRDKEKDEKNVKVAK